MNFNNHQIQMNVNEIPNADLFIRLDSGLQFYFAY